MSTNHSNKAIRLSSSHRNWRLYMTRKATPAFLAFQEKVFSRDNNTCQFCGFSSHQHMDVINLDNNYLNNKISNLATVCPFCMQCAFLQAVGVSDATGGFLIYLPEMSQAELNALCHNLFSSMSFSLSSTKDAKSIYRSLRLRSKLIEKELGSGFSNPSFYGQLLMDSQPEAMAKVHGQLIDKIRLLPAFNAFSSQVTDWSFEAAAQLHAQ